jgi:hypothetical protein
MRLFPFHRKQLNLGQVRGRSQSCGSSHVSARLGLRRVWFRSNDVVLEPSVEGFGSLALFAATHRRQRLHISQAVDAEWYAHVQQLIPWWEQWWHYRAQVPQVAGFESSDRAPVAARTTGLFFTGGVDSFFSLLHADQHPKVLVYVHGYDIPLRDRTRMNAFEPSFRAVAAAFGLESVVIQTNLREHPILKRLPWERFHGAALAAAGHVLSERLDRVLISSSLPPQHTGGWGSHFRTDPYWSSRAIEFIHVGATYSRRQKVLAIAATPLVQQHLRVCWENRTAAGNCSRCDKCLCVMTVLEQAGHLRAFRVFDHSESLTKRLDDLPCTHLPRTYRELLEHGVDKQLQAAVERLLARSPDAAPAAKPNAARAA